MLARTWPRQPLVKTILTRQHCIQYSGFALESVNYSLSSGLAAPVRHSVPLTSPFTELEGHTLPLAESLNIGGNNMQLTAFRGAAPIWGSESPSASVVSGDGDGAACASADRVSYAPVITFFGVGRKSKQRMICARYGCISHCLPAWTPGVFNRVEHRGESA